MQLWRKNWPEIRAALTAGLPEFVLHAIPPDQLPGVPVFCFHDVTHDRLEEDLLFLQHNRYHTLTAEELFQHTAGEAHADPRAIVLTFDDGSPSLYHIAYPLLKKYKMKAVAFIAPGLHHQIDAPSAARQPLTWGQLREMEDSGIIDCQSHTYLHRYIPRWPKPLPLEGVDQYHIQSCQTAEPLCLRADFTLARNILESRLDKTVQHLAFPQFVGNQHAILAGFDAGYRSFWWGSLPHRPLNPFAGSPTRIVRLKGDLLRRLPGKGRTPLACILIQRLSRTRLPTNARTPFIPVPSSVAADTEDAVQLQG